jgi:hypothetical protein
MKFTVFSFFLILSLSSFAQKMPEVEISGVGTYPNPFNQELFVQHEKEEDNDKIQKMEIYTESGNLVLSVNHSNVVETSRISSGKYILRIYYKDQIIVRKVVKN